METGLRILASIIADVHLKRQKALREAQAANDTTIAQLAESETYNESLP
ncbi:hypothetical protein Dform_01770 [Dehalogenimonas formicexedens]|uniref:Uncharacterized protein n=1 Tax=Dehalogenimonas formicexedens TaxID=1839801 RepID=A0A1P8F9E1_9CHLR|nr:hypothetical protein Dform_01770 [Dehalogenimonas formicexedens]